MGLCTNCAWTILAVACIFQCTCADYDINWIYPPLKKLLIVENAIVSVKLHQPFKAGLIPYRFTYNNQAYEMTFIIYPNHPKGVDEWNEDDWIISSLSHKNADTARQKALNNNKNLAYEEITERNKDGVQVFIYPTAFTTTSKKKGGHQYPFECRASIDTFKMDDREVDIVAYPWNYYSKQVTPKPLRQNIAMTAIMKILDELQITDIIFQDTRKKKCPHHGKVMSRAVSAFQKTSFYTRYNFEFNYDNIKEIKIGRLKEDCGDTYTEKIKPFVTFFNLTKKEDSLHDLMSHFVSVSVADDKWITKRVIEDINDDDAQINCKSFKDIGNTFADGSCGVQLMGLWNPLQKESTMMKKKEIKSSSESSDEQSVAIGISHIDYDYDYVMVAYMSMFGIVLLFMGAICGCGIGFVLYHVYKSYNANENQNRFKQKRYLHK